jgi:hypothetical protein
MNKGDEAIDRLLRAAAASTRSDGTEAPLGFETRVVALWRARRAEKGVDFWQFARVFRRVALGAAIFTAFASAGAFWQFQQNNELDEPTTSAYAIADTAIEAGAWQ